MGEFTTPVSRFHVFDRKNANPTDFQELDQLTQATDQKTGLSFIDHSYQSRYGSRYTDIHLAVGFKKGAATVDAFHSLATELGIDGSIGRVNGSSSRFVSIKCNAAAADRLAAYAKENANIDFIEDGTRSYMEIPEYTYGYKVLVSMQKPTSHFSECDMELVKPYILLYEENEPVITDALENLEQILQKNSLNGVVGVQLDNAVNGQILIYCTGNELNSFKDATGVTKILSGKREVASHTMMMF